MRIIQLMSLALLFAYTAGHAQMHSHGGGMRSGGDEAFDLIVESVDVDVAADLTATRESIDALRDELAALRDVEDADQEAIDTLRDELHTLRKSLRDQVRDIVDSNEDLQGELHALAQETREAMLVSRYVFHSDGTFDEIVASATADQASVLIENQGVIDALRNDIQVAREAGATREELSDQVTELRALMDEQRTLVGDVLDANDELLASVLEDAQNARESMRENARDRGGRGGHRRGPGG